MQSPINSGCGPKVIRVFSTKTVTSVPREVLNNLKCFHCANYLVQSPVYVEHTGEAVCGSCYSPERPAIRMKQYEEVAKLLVFPCINEEFGCKVQMPFDHTGNHKDICQYRQYVCPMLSSIRCAWLGPKADFLKHCEKTHSDSIKPNPITLIHDVTKSGEQNFLVRTFQALFLLHTKVCVKSGKIYHTVKYLGRSEDAKNFAFTLNIQRNEERFIRKGFVTNQENASTPSDTSLVLNISSLLDMLGGYDNISFTITLNQLPRSSEKCAKCKNLVTNLDYYNKGGWWCDRCAPAKQSCLNSVHGCTFYDFEPKCIGHRWFFCEQANYCNICTKDIPRGPLLEHYNASHQDKIYERSNMWRTEWTGSRFKYYLVPCVAGIAVCRYDVSCDLLKLSINIPVSSAELRKFKCSVRFVQVSTGQVRNYSVDKLYHEFHDWYIEIDDTDFPSWSDVFEVQVNITKLEP